MPTEGLGKLLTGKLESVAGFIPIGVASAVGKSRFRGLFIFCIGRVDGFRGYKDTRQESRNQKDWACI